MPSVFLILGTLARCPLGSWQTLPASAQKLAALTTLVAASNNQLDKCPLLATIWTSIPATADCSRIPAIAPKSAAARGDPPWILSCDR